MNTRMIVQVDPATFVAGGGGWTLAAAPPVVGGGERPTQTGTSAQPLGPANGQAQQAPGGMGPNMLLFMFIPLFLLLILMSTFGARKEKKKRAELLASLGRYDRVLTMGGVIGTIVEIKDDEIVLKVDESTNTKIHFSRGAVQSILKKGPGNGASLAAAETASAA